MEQVNREEQKAQWPAGQSLQQLAAIEITKRASSIATRIAPPILNRRQNEEDPQEQERQSSKIMEEQKAKCHSAAEQNGRQDNRPNRTLGKNPSKADQPKYYHSDCHPSYYDFMNQHKLG